MEKNYYFCSRCIVELIHLNFFNKLLKFKINFENLNYNKLTCNGIKKNHSYLKISKIETELTGKKKKMILKNNQLICEE